MIVRSRAPVRISFAGGGTDVEPYCSEQGSCVLNAAINKYIYSTLETRNDSKINIASADYLKSLKFHSAEEMQYNDELDLLKAVIKKMNPHRQGINIFVRSEVPPKSGLGSSGAAFVAMLGIFNHLRRERMLTDSEIAELAITLERKELKNEGGRQDQYAAVFGGMNFLEFKDSHTFVNPLKLRQDCILELEKNLVLVEIGERGASGDIIRDQISRYKRKERKTAEALDRTKEIAVEMKNLLIAGRLDRFGQLMDEAWQAKKQFSPLISNKRIDKFYEAAKNAGAQGGKVLGAGSGGHMLFYCKPDSEHDVLKQLELRGAKPIPFAFDFNGLQTWEAKK